MLAPVCADCVAHQCLLLDGIVRVSKPVKLVPLVFTQSDRRKNSADAGALKRKRIARKVGRLANLPVMRRAIQVDIPKGLVASVTAFVYASPRDLACLANEFNCVCINSV